MGRKKHSRPSGKRRGASPRGMSSALYHVFLSLRFGEAIGCQKEARILRDALLPYGIVLHMVEVVQGDINLHVFPLMEACHAFLAFGSMEYGEDTGNPASTHHEVAYFETHCKGRTLIPLRMIPFSETHEHTTAKRIFKVNDLQLEWIKGTALPSGLAEEIKKILETKVGRPWHRQASTRTNAGGRSSRGGTSAATRPRRLPWSGPPQPQQHPPHPAPRAAWPERRPGLAPPQP